MRATGRVLLDESEGLFDGLVERTLQFCMISDPGAIRATESANLDPGIRKVRQPIAAEQEDASWPAVPGGLGAG